MCDVRRKIMRTFALSIRAAYAVAVLVWLPSLAQAKLSWKVYVDKNYGYSIPVPANLSLLPWTGDPVSAWQIRSRTFASKDGKVSLSIVTHFTLDRTLQDFYNSEFASRLNGGDWINYRILKNNWYVISGTILSTACLQAQHRVSKNFYKVVDRGGRFRGVSSYYKQFILALRAI